MNSTTVLGQTTQTGKLFTGQGGMELLSTTNHPLRLGSGAGQIPQIELLATGTRDVEIKTPLKINNTQTTFSGGPQNITFNNNGGTPSTLQAALTLKANVSDVYTRTETASTFQMKIDTFAAPLKFVVGALNSTLSIDPASALTINEATITNSLTTGSLTVNGNMTVTGTTSFANPYWVAVVINFVGGVPTIVRNAGRYSATSLVRVSGFATGAIQFDFPLHPQGSNFMVSSSAVAGYGTILSSVRTSTRIGITMRNTANSLFDTEAHVLILAY
jgi:hypothetical protein